MEIYIDGASRGNPGPAGAGAVLLKGGRIVKQLSVYLGVQTNNVAEYKALIFALEEALRLKEADIKVYTDSQLLARQINREYKIKSPNLSGLFQEAQNLLSAFVFFQIIHIPREENKEADKLATEAADRKQ